MVAMTRTWAELLLLAALVAAAWIVVGHEMRSPASAGAGARVAAAVQGDPVGNGLGDRARRLRTLTESPPPRGPVRRNPFTFPPSSRAAAAAPPAAAQPEEPAVEARPDLVLSGIAEDGVDGGTVRTAVIVAGGQLVFAREGDRVLSRFVVLRIAADAVQLKDTERGDVFTLAFK
jgi:hypothetical protein